jgi:hypothetical protein
VFELEWRGALSTEEGKVCQLEDDSFVLDRLTSLQTSIVPKTTWRPSKKLSPTMMTVEPPDVHPSLGLMAFMQGVATGKGGYNPGN